jgi:DNA processing protein
MSEKEYWVAFNVCQGIGPVRFKLLLEYFGSAQKAFEAPVEELIKIGLPKNLVSKFADFRKNFDPVSYFIRVEKMGIKILTSEDKYYPKLLKEIQDYPTVLYVKSKSLNDIFLKKAIAVVGTRTPTDYGRKATETIVKQLVTSGWVIVSGLARGIDRAAHQTAIKNNGLTIAVLGTGFDNIYPPENKSLAEKIVETGGAVISEFPLGAKIEPGNFPARNRIISGLSLGVVVTEAACDSGSLITASWAANQGREVFAVPGPVTSKFSAGTSELIKKGAKLVWDVNDILEEL